MQVLEFVTHLARKQETEDAATLDTGSLSVSSNDDFGNGSGSISEDSSFTSSAISSPSSSNIKDEDGMSLASPAKSVRFSLQLNQFHEPVLCLTRGKEVHNNAGLIISTKSVCFNLKENQSYEDQSELSQEERKHCWYDNRDIENFEEQAIEDARTIIFRNSTTSLLPKDNQRVKMWFKGGNGSFLTGNNATSSPNTNEILKSLQQTFEVCSKAKSDRIRRNFQHRDALEQVYEQHGEMMGLEHFLVSPLRGDPQALRRFILDQGRAFHIMAQSSTQQQQSPKSLADTLAHVSKCVSRPSRLMSHETALAHSRAMSA
eukprot:CAMPEP_0172472248 /NCGR_PEP_ID=MMETSP1065-20121228/68239_1 /TAXON_ID=265537 /ORGANISM="Amphiprora paludosa, Strain CCMP125" /LENGTH=316 /DNA_ID=CAMNT_0013230379 /DNA_START=78 /DNA_END=1028 /DNA_ORIENTATION=+